MWEEKFKQLWKQNKTPQEMADRLKVDIQVVQAKLIQYRSIQKKRKITEQTILCRRKAWLEILKTNSNKSRNQIQIMFPTEYYQLYRNDKTWLMANMPPHGKYRKPKIDWEERDNNLSNQVVVAAEFIRDSGEKLTRVTVKGIGKHLNKCALLEQQLDKLPKTKKALMKVVETQNAFYLRKIRFLIEHMLNVGNDPDVRTILRLGRFPNIYGKIILEEIKIFKQNYQQSS